MWVSYDEGKTWPTKKSICTGQSAYSSITILPDGTIGVYLEEDGSTPYKMYFLNFSLKWLTNGADQWAPASSTALPELNTFSVNVSPNPVKNSSRIKFNKQGKYTLTIYSLTGIEMSVQQIETDNSGEYDLNFSNYAPNVYIIKVTEASGKEEYLKIIK
jgi:hypothetical protein